MRIAVRYGDFIECASNPAISTRRDCRQTTANTRFDNVPRVRSRRPLLLLQAIFVHRHTHMPRAGGGVSQNDRAGGQFRDVVNGARAPEHADMPIVLQHQRCFIAVGAARLDQEQRTRFDLRASDHDRARVAIHPDSGHRVALAQLAQIVVSLRRR